MPSLKFRRLGPFAILLALAAALCPAQDSPPLELPTAAIEVDGDTAEWPNTAPLVSMGAAHQVLPGTEPWAGERDFAAVFRFAADAVHLYFAGRIEDDQLLAEPAAIAAGRADRIEFLLCISPDADAGAPRPQWARLVLSPLCDAQPWNWVTIGADGRREYKASLAGLRVAAVRESATSYRFEAAVPLHLIPGLQPGAQRLGLQIEVYDQDDANEAKATTLWWPDAASPQQAATLLLPDPGALQPRQPSTSLLARLTLADLPYLLVPLATLLLLLLLWRGWNLLAQKARWLQPWLYAAGIALLLLGLSWPDLLTGRRAAAQRELLAAKLEQLQPNIDLLTEGSLKSYRGPSRDRALVDLLAGKRITRQRSIQYRALASLVPGQFGPPWRSFDDLPVMPYWLPLGTERTESFQFDPPLQGQQLHLVIGRPYLAQLPFLRDPDPPRLRVELDYGTGERRPQVFELERGFGDASSLGREYAEAAVLPIRLDRELRGLSLGVLRGADLRLVGLSLERTSPSSIEPLPLGTASFDGVPTDLRGAYPRDAGIELLPGATARVPLPAALEAPQKLWFFYAAVYPGQPAANPGAKVAEIVLHFRGDRPAQRLLLEHQVSIFYERALNNTRDRPPEGSPATIGLSWLDEQKEMHVNLVLPVQELPAGAELDAIEFRNLGNYRIRFRSVVLGNERSTAPQDPPQSPLQRDGAERFLPAEFLAALQGCSAAIYRGDRLSESTAVDRSGEAPILPRVVAERSGTTVEQVLRDGSRRVSLFAPLAGDGWDGAVIALSSVDAEWAAARQLHARFGLALCLLASPLLLLLLCDVLSAASNLRWRLLVVLGVAALVPLGVLSIVLARILESGHSSDLREGMRVAVRTAVGQLEDQKDRVRSSARQWLRDLAETAAVLLPGGVRGVEPARLDAVAASLQKLLAGQLPPEWRGGFLRLEWLPQAQEAAQQPVVLLAGDARMAALEAPARVDPGLFLQWGAMMIAVRAEESTPAGTFLLTAGRPLDTELLGALAPGQMVLLTDTRGYPLVGSTGRGEAGELLQQALLPAVMLQRERLLQRGLAATRPVVESLAHADEQFVQGGEVLRDLQGTPRGLLLVLQPEQRATLDFAVGRIPVRAFFLLAGGSLMVMLGFLAFVVSGRIGRPLAQLAAGATELLAGRLPQQLPAATDGQLGLLAQAFERMTTRLQGRDLDLRLLRRLASDLTAIDNSNAVLTKLLGFAVAQSPADHCAVLWLAGEQPQLLRPGQDAAAAVDVAVVPLLQAARGPFCVAARRGLLAAPWAGLLVGARSLVGLPFRGHGRHHGVLLLGFARLEPPPIDYELLGAAVAIAASALLRTEILALAVRDPATGSFAPQYFRRRLADEVAVAEQQQRPLRLLGVQLGSRESRPRGLPSLVEVLAAALPPAALWCDDGGGRLLVLLPDGDAAVASALEQRIQRDWASRLLHLPAYTGESAGLQIACVAFPVDAPSAAALLDRLTERLLQQASPPVVADETDAVLRAAGVTAISPAMREVYSLLRRVAPTDLPVLLEGETGVGKEVLTKLLHQWSRRATGPLVRVHCAALSETLLASELFGHEKGAFTGADRRKIGRFEQADGGTLFLDEVGEIPLEVQVKLLRVLQEQEIDRVGGTEPVRVDVRVVAATNRDMQQLVAAGRFREDLYYRLQGLVVRVPPLRERRAEIGALVEHFREEVVAAGQTQVSSIAADAMDLLYRHDWPGNIRELRNAVFRAMVLARDGVVQPREVAAALAGTAGPLPSTAGGLESPPPGGGAGIGPGLPASDLEMPAGQADAPALAAAGEEVAAAADVGTQVPADAELLPRQQALLDLVRQLGTLKTEQHQEAAGVSRRTSLRDLQYLVKIGLLERVGTRRGTFYRPRA